MSKSLLIWHLRAEPPHKLLISSTSTDHNQTMNAEFKFLVIGHEFGHYPKKMIRDIRNWDWFLEEEHKEDSDEDEVSDRKPTKGKRRKRKKGGANDDEDDDVWTGESEEDAELIKKLKNDPKPKYKS
ncbi:hypothetical protein CTI12_AA291940 [Artemisia annua]|uniref:Uncharacterized protein n=1 Tax=Artemisia annua TaxID=35608 RepID=A0A2U1N8Y3_ARTAN|nr:hypothetical protein CTI12_AA291940 [Artemisia annua]